MHFWKYHGLGNDYLVVKAYQPLSPAMVRRICHRHLGIGSDGILVQAKGERAAQFGLKIYNPDGSSAEKSGNGLRIFARYLYDTRQVDRQPFIIATDGGHVTAHVLSPQQVEVSMGKALYAGATVLTLANGQQFEAHVVSMGNPHCVIFCDERIDAVEALASRWGGELEHHLHFPNRTNVQFVRVLARDQIYIAIWERGVGRTLASGTSSSAAAAVAQRLGYCDQRVTVQMAGGSLEIRLGSDGGVVLRGEVTQVGSGTISAEIFSNMDANENVT